MLPTNPKQECKHSGGGPLWHKWHGGGINRASRWICVISAVGSCVPTDTK